MDILNEVMEQIRPLNEALTEKARVTHALRKLIAAVDTETPFILGHRRAKRLMDAVAEAKEALK